MVRRLHASLLPALVVAVLLAGCGSSSSSSSSSGSSAATAPTSSAAQTGSTATTPTSTTPTSTTPTSTSPKLPRGAAAVASCRHGVQSLPHLKQSIKEKLEEICQKAASGDVNAKRKAAQEACRELVNASPLPAGEARDRALAACKNAGGAK
jgi:ABC-type Fe3+-hydroxamate transport system substrate-binding protein